METEEGRENHTAAESAVEFDRVAAQGIDSVADASDSRRRSRSEGGASDGGDGAARHDRLPRRSADADVVTAHATQQVPSHVQQHELVVNSSNPSWDDTRCLRIGVFHPSIPVTREQIIDEIDSVKMTSRVEHVAMEPLDEYRAPSAYWGRVYFSSPELADLCAVELNTPRRVSKWKYFVTQRLPRLGPGCGEIRTIPAFEPFHAEPADSIAVETPEGFVVFSTDEVYRTKGVVDYVEAKQAGRILHRLVCKHFDPQRRFPCRFGAGCNYIHVKAIAMWKLLLPVTSKSANRHRYAIGDGDTSGLHTSFWEFSRRLDTLVVRYLQPEHDVDALRYMFGGCQGFADCFVQCTRDGKRFGFVRFTSQDSAFHALAQTKDCNLNVSFYGCLEDLRRCQSLAVGGGQRSQRPHELDGSPTAPERPLVKSSQIAHRPETHFRGAASSRAHNDRREDHSASRRYVDDGPSDQPAAKADGGSPSDERDSAAQDVDTDLPFPPLPEGWEHGVSRRTSQYYFFQPKTKNSTTWKHPSTGERYSTN